MNRYFHVFCIAVFYPPPSPRRFFFAIKKAGCHIRPCIFMMICLTGWSVSVARPFPECAAVGLMQSHFLLRPVYCNFCITVIVQLHGWACCLTDTFRPTSGDLLPLLICIHQPHYLSPSGCCSPVKSPCLQFFRFAVVNHAPVFSLAV